MRKHNRAYMKMVYALLNFFVKYAQKIAKDSIVQNTLKLITDRTKLVKHFREIQNRDTRGITIQKSESKLSLAKAILLVSSIERTFAFDTNNHTLFKAVDDSKSTLIRMGDTILLRYGRTVISYANKFAEELKVYDLKPETIENLIAEIANYNKWMTKPREAQSEKVTATKEIRFNVAELRKLITGNLDNAMFKYSTTDKPFYQEYVSIREIIDPITTRRNLLIHVINEETKQGEPNVAVTIIRFKASADLVNHIKLTGKEGNTSFTGLEPGKYTARFKKYGFDTLEVIFYINKNEVTVLEAAIRVKE